MMMRTIRLRDGSVIRVALWREAASGKIALALEADLGRGADEPAPLAPADTRPRVVGVLPRLVLRPLRAAIPAGAMRRAAAASLRLGPRETRQPTPLAAALATLRAPLPPRPQTERSSGANQTARALQPASKPVAVLAPRAPPPLPDAIATAYDAAFLLGPIAG